MELLDILENNLLKKYSYNDIAKNINISIGTIKRWVLLRNVPNAYRFELMNIANMIIKKKINSSLHTNAPHTALIYGKKESKITENKKQNIHILNHPPEAETF